MKVYTISELAQSSEIPWVFSIGKLNFRPMRGQVNSQQFLKG